MPKATLPPRTEAVSVLSSRRQASDSSSPSPTNKKHHPEDLSPYELERLENIRQNQAFLTAIELPQASAAVKRKPSQRGITREKPKVSKTEALPVRKSLRLQKKDVEMTLLPKNPPSVQPPSVQPEVRMRLEGPIAMVPANMEEAGPLPASLLELWRERVPIVEKEKWNQKEYAASLKKMSLSEERVVKVVKDRIFSAAFHPCASRLLLAAGDKWGRVALWGVDGDWGDDGVLLFEPHTRPVSSMAFSSTQPADLLTLSYDGSLRSTDLEKAVFEEVYCTDVGLSSFDFLSHDCSTLLVGDWDGDVAIVDRRTPGTSPESLSTLDPKTLRFVHVHPVQKQYFVAAKNRDVHIYDVRSLKKKASQPVSALPGHTLSISSAYFSPVTGNRVLTTCMDDKIRVFDTSELKPLVPLLSSLRHSMQTGRWLTKLRAVWDPKKEDCFSVGSVERPRRIRLFHESGQLLHSFQDQENLSTVCSVTAFHPSRNALLGGNASGRLHVFTD